VTQVEPSAQQTPWLVDFLWHANPWVIVIGALLLFFLARAVLDSLFAALARYIALGVKTLREWLSGRR
jgi:hypothetical protein